MPDPGSPPPFAVPDTLQSLVREIGRHGERDAVVFFDRGSERRWSYRRLAEDAEKLARGLARHGIGAKDALVIRARNRPEWIVTCFATLRLGATLVPLDTQLDGEDFRHVLSDSGARLLFTTAVEASHLREACRAASVEIVLLEDEDAGGDRCWRSLLSDAAATADLPAVAADDAAVLFYTSGTTGAAKGVPLPSQPVVPDRRIG